jgi:hypothetical protein
MLDQLGRDSRRHQSGRIDRFRSVLVPAADIRSHANSVLQLQPCDNLHSIDLSCSAAIDDGLSQVRKGVDL